MALPVLRFNFASPDGDPARKREMVSAALDMAEWGDRRGSRRSVSTSITSPATGGAVTRS